MESLSEEEKNFDWESLSEEEHEEEKNLSEDSKETKKSPEKVEKTEQKEELEEKTKSPPPPVLTTSGAHPIVVPATTVDPPQSKEESKPETHDILKNSSLNLHAKPFVLNPNAKSFQPKQYPQQVSTPPRTQTQSPIIQPMPPSMAPMFQPVIFQTQLGQRMQQQQRPQPKRAVVSFHPPGTDFTAAAAQAATGDPLLAHTNYHDYSAAQYTPFMMPQPASYQVGQVLPMPSATPAAGPGMMTPPSGATMDMSQQPSGHTMFTNNLTMAEEEEETEVEDGICPDGKHKWKKDQCMICTVCGECTGYSLNCCNSGDKERQSAMLCGCGAGDSGCSECGICRTCAGEQVSEMEDHAKQLELLARHKDYLPFDVEQILGGNEKHRHSLLERISSPTEFKALLSKGTYASYENRVYLAGSVKTGKSTLASVLIGEQIPTDWKSTDGLIIHFGKNGIDIKERKMIPLKKGGEGHDVFAKLLLGNVELKYSGTQTKLPGKKSGNIETEGMHTEEITVVDTANLELSIKKDMRDEILQGNYKMNIAPSDLVDFGGQKSYDMTHQLFIQCKGTFVLMFDGRFSLYDALEEYKPNEITTMSILIHWIDSILTYCVDESIEEHKLPKIVFAATHGDFYTQDELGKKKAIFIDELTKTFSSNDLHEHIIYQTVFFFDARNQHDSELQKLTKHLVDIAFAQPSWGQQMPVAWVPLELQISKMKTTRMNFVRKSELQKINIQNGDLALSNSQFDHFLKVQHSLGKLMYFGDHGIDNFIVIQPSAFVNVLRSFVTDEMFWQKDKEVINILPILSKTGVLQRNDLYKLWEQEHFEQLVPTDDLKKYIIDVLIHLDILVEPKRYRGAEKSAEFFLVPCMIKEKAPTSFLNLEEMADKMICMSYRLKRSSVPAALIFKLIGSALNVLPIKETDGRPCLYYQAATFSIDDDNECRIHMKGSRIVVNLINKVSRLEISPDIAASIQECLTLTLTNVLHFYYACMGNDIKKVDILKLFESEVGVLCGKTLCFIPVDEAMKRKTWTCEKEKIHETQLHWILDENIGQDECPPGCDGISAKDLCRSPNDKHLVRLASELNIKNFHEFILHLGLKTKDWDQIGYNWGRAEDAKVVALLQWKERNEIVTFEKLLDAQACIGDNQHHLCKVFKGQTGLLEYTSFKYQDTPKDSFLSNLSVKLGNCVIQLGIELGLTFSDIDAVFVRHPKDLFSQMYEVLKIWKQKTPENTYLNLMLAIQRVKGKQFIKRNFCCNM